MDIYVHDATGNVSKGAPSAVLFMRAGCLIPSSNVRLIVLDVKRHDHFLVCSVPAKKVVMSFHTENNQAGI